MIGLAIFSAASLACGLAGSDTFLIVMRGVQGFGAALVLPAALSIVMNMFPEGAERNKALGIWGAMGAMGATVGRWPGACSPVTSDGSTSSSSTCQSAPRRWRWRPKIVPESRLRIQRRRYDPFGAPSITLGTDPRRLRHLAGAASRLGGSPNGGHARGGRRVAGRLPRRRDPGRGAAAPLRLFRLSTVAGSNAVGFLLGASFFAFIFIGTLYMQQVLGFSALKTGLAWLAASVTSVAFAGLSQKLVTTTSAKMVMAFGMALIGGGILWATQIPAHGNFWHDLAGPFFVAGMGTAFAFIPVSIGALAGIRA